MTSLRTITTNGVRLNVAVAGSGPPVVLLHGFPHTWRLWEPVMAELATDRTVIAPDLRGLGDSQRPAPGYTAADVAADVVGLLDALGLDRADVVGTDLSGPAAFLVGIDHPQRVRKLVVMETLVGDLPGAEAFLAGGPPWWFGFHAVPGLAESVLVGHGADYVDWFLDTGTLGDGVTPVFRDAVRAAYESEDALHAAFEHYRALPESGRQVAAAVRRARLTVPTLAIGAATVGDATHRQLVPVADDLSGVVLADSGHIVAQHRPAELVNALRGFLG